ncbi:hypothetical protein H0H81_001376 [Sphagnurus paluster]|uniref:Xylanolytic transcriptional activator regulatory domain-containing protein n=1 Tax=Sphagnurus paluster TaxID=117069 RepID=A0A9P7FMM6_9AGAR|nr:hypothetical protein H0H81_001376 [Sphagnurus paluster]
MHKPLSWTTIWVLSSVSCAGSAISRTRNPDNPVGKLQQLNFPMLASRQSGLWARTPDSYLCPATTQGHSPNLERDVAGDGAGSQCTNCIDYGFSCTYVEVAKKRGPPKSYVESLENRVEKLQDLISKISPEALEHIDSAPDVPFPASLRPPSTLHTHWPAFDPAPARFIRHLGTGTAPPIVDDEDFLTDNLDKLHIQSNKRFFGKSSGAMLIKTALELKEEYLGVHEQRLPWPDPNLAPLPTLPPFTFPPPDLLASLVDLYFVHMNRYLPLLHHPTFERALTQGLHHTDRSFGSTVLLVCAVAGCFLDDPRVMDDPPDGGPQNAHSSGWKWFAQVPLIKPATFNAPCLYELQFYALFGQFLQASSVPQACWTVVGIGICIAQDVGAHRRRKRAVHTVEDELCARAFWVLVCMDRLFSSSLGRPCSIHDEDFDIDLPIECDDEYWEHPDPEQRWRQPTPDKTPSLVTYFVVYIRLNQILAFLLRTVYAINKSKILLGFVGQQWEENIVSELDSALNVWVDLLPDHLRWDPTRENDIFFNQSASLYSAYYHVQILVHCLFILSARNPRAALAFPSLAICTNAAHACSHVLDAQRKRLSVAPPPLQTSAFSAGVVLLLSLWGGKRASLKMDYEKEMGDVKRCMDILEASESSDILCKLASVGDLPLPKSSTGTSTAQKRDHKADRDGDNESLRPGSGYRSGSGSVSALHHQTMAAPRSATGRSIRRHVSVAGSASGSMVLGSGVGVGGGVGLGSGGGGGGGSGRVASTERRPPPLTQEQLYTLEYEFGPHLYRTGGGQGYQRPLARHQHQHQSHPYQHQQHQSQSQSQSQSQLMHPEYWYGASGRGEQHHPQHQQYQHTRTHLQTQRLSRPHTGHGHSPVTSTPSSSSGYSSSYYGASPVDIGIMSSFAGGTGTGTGGTGAGAGAFAQSHDPGYAYQIGQGREGLGAGVGVGAMGIPGVDVGAGAGSNGVPTDETFAMWSEAPAGFE